MKCSSHHLIAHQRRMYYNILVFLILLCCTRNTLVEARIRSNSSSSRKLEEGSSKSAQTNNNQELERPQPQPPCFACHLVRTEILLEEDDDDDENSNMNKDNDVHDDNNTVQCLTQVEGTSFRQIFDIHLTQDFLTLYSNEIARGEAHVCIPGGYIDEQQRTIIIPDNNTVLELQPELHQRHLQNINSRNNNDDNDDDENTNVKIGERRLLTIRVVARTDTQQEEPDESMDHIQGAIFGTGPNPEGIALDSSTASVVEQYRAVSHGQLKFTAAPVTWDDGSVTTTGVVQVELENILFAGKSIREDMLPEILKATEAQIGRMDELADYYIFCVPTGSLLTNSETWTAFTYLYETFSIYQQSRCTRLSVVMHEMGHGLGFKHSGIGTNDYGDKSGYMGYALNYAGYPLKAFNAHKHWISGWFQDKSVTVSKWMIENDYQVRVAAFVDYSKLVDDDDDDGADKYSVLLRVGDLYIQYNQAKGYNVGTDATYVNEVTMVEASHAIDVSDMLASIGPDQQYVYENYNGGTENIVIEVCELNRDSGIDYAVVNIHIDDGSGVSRCRDDDTEFNNANQSSTTRTTNNSEEGEEETTTTTITIKTPESEKDVVEHESDGNNTPSDNHAEPQDRVPEVQNENDPSATTSTSQNVGDSLDEPDLFAEIEGEETDENKSLEANAGGIGISNGFIAMLAVVGVLVVIFFYNLYFACRKKTEDGWRIKREKNRAVKRKLPANMDISETQEEESSSSYDQGDNECMVVEQNTNKNAAMPLGKIVRAQLKSEKQKNTR